jgi:aminoglycoside 6'-N-acetyltransferase
MRLRPATLADVPLLRHWDTQPHVVAADPNDDWQWEVELARTPAWRESLIAEVDGRLIGFLEIIDPQLEETHYWGPCGPGLRAIDIWIGAAADLGRGHGTVMMDLAIERCFADPGVHAILLDPLVSNERAQRFYRRLGFRAVGDRWFGADHCTVHRLDRRGPADAASAEVRQAGLGEVRPVQFAVLRPDGPLPGDRPAPEGAAHIGAFDGPTAIGAATVLAAEYPGPGVLAGPTWQLRGVVVRADWRGTGVGRRVVDAAVAAARQHGAATLWAAARASALGFYEAGGWQVVGPEWVKPGVGPHRYITWQAGWAATTGTPAHAPRGRLPAGGPVRPYPS